MASGVCVQMTDMNSKVNIWHKFSSHITKLAIKNIFFIPPSNLSC